MCENKKPVFTGILLILIGLLFFLHNLGYLSGDIWRFWPLILIIWGIKKLFY
ncbi:MAG: DUF5668 domain-containing protein [candidate division Zixibacteria bacterium]|jgi:hypothetical protein|nr:DUF5668 domain-containing protein [candidate division Zixibacteria bacterium]